VTTTTVPWHPARLFLASFLALFLELLLIRWVPSVVRVVAYYSNLMLLSSFLGLGCGSLIAARGWRVYRAFGPLVLLLAVVVTSLRGVVVVQGPEEFRFLFDAAAHPTVLPIVLVFLVNALVFVPLGELIGLGLKSLPPLRGYAFDLGGSLAGSMTFGLVSWFWFSPVMGLVAATVMFALLVRGNVERLLSVTTLATAVVVMLGDTDPNGLWSPYNHITVHLKGDEAPDAPGVAHPPPQLHTLKDPPAYVVQVNHDFYMLNTTLNPARYSDPEPARFMNQPYLLPYVIHPQPQDVLVVGAGGGTDVEAALLAGARHVDAVEIDPVIIDVGLRFNASGSYLDPRVTIHNEDGRAFLQHSSARYDVIIFGFLDSQSLFSQMSNIRLDSYVYTRESFQSAWQHLNPNGIVSVSFFYAGKRWMLDRLATMLGQASGSEVLVYLRPTGHVTMVARRGAGPEPPAVIGSFGRMDWKAEEPSEARDDWPYLYLRGREVPSDYALVVSILLLVSVVMVLVLRRRARWVDSDAHFFALGAGFLLLETSSMTTVSLLLGTTWLVSMVVITGVLLAVLAANLVAGRWRLGRGVYVGLFASLVMLWSVEPSWILGASGLARLAWSVLVVPLPIFFAGLIFSTGFRSVTDTAAAFGVNLLGAMVGGFAEYLSMVTGLRALLLVVMGFYLLSLITMPRASPSDT